MWFVHLEHERHIILAPDMSSRSSLQSSPASYVRISSRIAAWFIASLIVASLGLIFAKVVVDPASRPTKESISYQQVLPG